MKKLLVLLMMVLMGLLLITPVASADQVSVGDYVKIDLGLGNANGGGAFKISGSGVNEFYTFCLERNEYFSPGSSYYVGSITGGAINGGISGGNPDPISSATAYLYYQWATGIIDNTATNANALQLAIWKLEGEWSSELSGLSLTYYNNANSNSNGTFYGVQVMNMYSSYTNGVYSGNQQDQLVFVPEPAALLLLGLGLVGIGILRRKQ